MVGVEKYGSDILYVERYTKDGEFVRSTLIHIHMGEYFILNGIAVTTVGRIAVITNVTGLTGKVSII